MIARDAAGALGLVLKQGNYQDCRVHALEANVWEFQSRLVEAERLLRWALRKFPREPFAYMALGQFCSDYGTQREARTVLAKGPELSLARRAGRDSLLGEEIVYLLAESHVGSRGGAARIEALARGLVAWPKSAYVAHGGGPYAEHSPGSFAKAVRKETGLAGFHCHQMRHAFASQWAERGGNLAALQVILGHASIVTTQQ